MKCVAHMIVRRDVDDTNRSYGGRAPVGASDPDVSGRNSRRRREILDLFLFWIAPLAPRKSIDRHELTSLDCMSCSRIAFINTSPRVSLARLGARTGVFATAHSRHRRRTKAPHGVLSARRSCNAPRGETRKMLPRMLPSDDDRTTIIHKMPAK